MNSGIGSFAKYFLISFGGVTLNCFYLRRHKSPVVSDETIEPVAIGWNSDWDCRQPLSNGTTNEPVPTATRHIILVRHGQCDYRNPIDNNRILTALGRKQAVFTASRLLDLKIPFDKLVCSTMVRAQETGAIILQYNPDIPLVEKCPLIVEGIPCVPSPYEYWNEEPFKIWEDKARIEAAFRKHFHRADAIQKRDSYTLMVGHANVIRYLTCRALQLPPEAWLRFTLYHGSITWLSIDPDGDVTLHNAGEVSHIPPEFITLMNAR